jgi:hypothetical protein
MHSEGWALVDQVNNSRLSLKNFLYVCRRWPWRATHGWRGCGAPTSRPCSWWGFGVKAGAWLLVPVAWLFPGLVL